MEWIDVLNRVIVCLHWMLLLDSCIRVKMSNGKPSIDGQTPFACRVHNHVHPRLNFRPIFYSHFVCDYHLTYSSMSLRIRVSFGSPAHAPCEPKDCALEKRRTKRVTLIFFSSSGYRFWSLVQLRAKCTVFGIIAAAVWWIPFRIHDSVSVRFTAALNA